MKPRPHKPIPRIERIKMTLKRYYRHPATYKAEIMRLEREMEILERIEKAEEEKKSREVLRIG